MNNNIHLFNHSPLMHQLQFSSFFKVEQEFKDTEGKSCQILMLLSVFYSCLSTPNLTVFFWSCLTFIKSFQRNLIFLRLFFLHCIFIIYMIPNYITNFYCNHFKYVWEQRNQLLLNRQHNWWQKCSDVFCECHQNELSWLRASEKCFTGRVEAASVKLVGLLSGNQLGKPGICMPTVFLLFQFVLMICDHSTKGKKTSTSNF